MPDAGQFLEDDLDLLAARTFSPSLTGSVRHELGNFAGSTAAEIDVLAHDHYVKVPSCLVPECAHVVVSPISGGSDHADA
jgi:hypothetical protein